MSESRETAFPRLLITDALGRRIVTIDKPRFTIGRRSETDLRLAGADISRVHAEITVEDGSCTLRDLASRYGTFVNGEQTTERVLVHGDHIRLGQSDDTKIVFGDEFHDAFSEHSSSVAGSVVQSVRRLLSDNEYYRTIAETLEHNHVHCPDIDSLDLQQQLRNPDSEALHWLGRGFHRIVELDARQGCDENRTFDLTKFLGHIAKKMSDAFGLSLPQDEFHPEEVSQVLKDEPRSLFCFLNVTVIPADQLRRLRGFTQEHHRALLCGPHPLDDVKTSTVDRLQDQIEVRRVTIEIPGMEGLLQRLRGPESGDVLDEVLAIVLDYAIELTAAERGFIMLANREGVLEFKLARARGKVTLSGRTFETSRQIPENVFATGQQTIVEDLLEGDLAQLHIGTVALGIRHVLCTPLRLVRDVERAEQKGVDNIIGVLYLDSRERGALLSASAKSALDTLSAEAALAIENARLYREALDKAKLEQEVKLEAAIQQSLLPVANREGAFFSTAAASIASRAVSGDFFDYVDLPTDRFGFIVGDVPGEGSPAALLAAIAVGMFSAEATYQAGAAPLITRLNQGLFRHSVEARFLTTFYGVLGADGSLTYCNAGHNAPLLVTASGIRRLETGGSVLGLFEHAAFEEEIVTLMPGDLIVAFSDGAIDAMNPDSEKFTDDRLLACANVHRDQTPQEVLDALLADLRAFCRGATPKDDVTIVVVRYEG